MGSARIQGLEYDVLNVDPAAISELDTYTDARAALVLISDTVSSGDVADHADYPVGNSPMEGMNNKIKVIKRKAYGYHDIEYFVLKSKTGIRSLIKQPTFLQLNQFFRRGYYDELNSPTVFAGLYFCRGGDIFGSDDQQHCQGTK